MAARDNRDAENKAFLKRYDRAKANREKVASVLDDCYEFGLPLRERVYSNGKDYRARTERLFDDTAAIAVQDGASRMLDDVFPTDGKPFELAAGSDIDPAQAEEVNRALSVVTEDLVQTIANSNFRAAAHEALMDWHIAKGILTIEPGDAINPINCRCIPLTEALIDLGPKGDVDCLFRTLTVRAGDIEHRWPDATIPAELAKKAKEQPDTEIELVEGAWRDWSEKGTETWCMRVVWKDKKATLYDRREKGAGSKPFVDFDFARTPGHVLGRGPVQMALEDIKTLNLVKEMSLEAMDLALSGMWQAEDDGVINVDTIEIAPRTIIPVAQGSGGLKRIDDSTDLRSAEWLIKTLGDSIRRAIDGDDLGPVKNSPMSATEVLERSSARARRRAGPYSRLIVELLGQTVQRVAYIRGKQGRITLPPIDGRTIAIRALAPLTRSMAQDEILRTMRFFEAANGAFGPQIAAMVIKQEDAARWLASKFGVDPNLVRTSLELKELAAQVAQMSAAAQAQPGAAPMAA
jgi:hypothetical protein